MADVAELELTLPLLHAASVAASINAIDFEPIERKAKPS
jgi:hypothetical protein